MTRLQIGVQANRGYGRGRFRLLLELFDFGQYEYTRLSALATWLVL